MHSQYLSITSWNYSISKMSTLRGLDADFLFLKDFYIYQNGVVAKVSTIAWISIWSGF